LLAAIVLVPFLAIGGVPAATVSFAPAVSLTVGNGPRWVAVGDFNGDGKLDLVAANLNSNSVYVLLGDGKGGFGPAMNFAAGMTPFSVAVGDFNGDGKLDLAVANFGMNQVSILLGDGTGNFGPPNSFAVGSLPVAVAVGDFNADGKLDLAVANFSSSNISILLGQGNGSFGAAQNFNVGTNPRSVAVGDFNGDGKLDLAVANDSSSDVSVLLGNGNGTFQPATNFPAGSSPFWVAVGDFNGDGKLDLVVANGRSTTVSVLLGDGKGGFGNPTSTGVGSSPQSVVVADFNGDGKLDVATANTGGGDVSVVLGDGTGNFGPAANFAVGSSPLALAAGDVNGDGKPDLVVADFAINTVSLLLNTSVSAAAPRNQPPVANAGPDQTIECSSPEGTPVTLTGSGSDPDGDTLMFTWKDAEGNVVGRSAVASVTVVGLGAHTFTLIVDDGHGNAATATTHVTLGDTIPPALSVSLWPNVLWPPNNRWVRITANIRVSDRCDPHPSVVLVSITSNEASEGRWEGHSSSDIRGAKFGTDDRSFWLRARRWGKGHGRVYTVTYRAMDASGNKTFASAQVLVPHEKGKERKNPRRRRPE